MCSNVDTNLSWTCLVPDFLISNIPSVPCFASNIHRYFSFAFKHILSFALNLPITRLRFSVISDRYLTRSEDRATHKVDLSSAWTRDQLNSAQAIHTRLGIRNILMSIGREGQLHTFIYDKGADFNVNITNIPCLRSDLPSSPAYGVLSPNLNDTPGYAAPYMNVLFFLVNCSKRTTSRTT